MNPTESDAVVTHSVSVCSITCFFRMLKTNHFLQGFHCSCHDMFAFPCFFSPRHPKPVRWSLRLGPPTRVKLVANTESQQMRHRQLHTCEARFFVLRNRVFFSGTSTSDDPSDTSCAESQFKISTCSLCSAIFGPIETMCGVVISIDLRARKLKRNDIDHQAGVLVVFL